VNKFGKTEKWLAAAALCAVAIYFFLAYPCYTAVKKKAVTDAYNEVNQMDFTHMDDEDEDILLGLQSRRIDVIIADEKLNPVYSNRSRQGVEQVDKYIVGKLDQFQEKPKPLLKDYQNLSVVRLKAVSVQNGKTFYLVIRTEIRGVREMIKSTVWFMVICILLTGAVYYILRKREENRKDTSDREVENRARELVEAQKEFVANISHSLKTPLAVISGQVEMLECMGDEIDREYYYDSIHEEIYKMSDMVSTLLDLTIMDHRIEKMEMCSVNLSELMDYMVLKYDAIFKKNKIKLQTKIEGGCIVEGNRMYLEDAVNNYIMNAVSFTPQGKKIGIFLSKENKDAAVRIFNEGSQIPEDKMDDIWSSFYRDSSGKYNAEKEPVNAGLGLYLVKKIAEQHKGSYGAGNRDGGVEFWLKVPLQ